MAYYITTHSKVHFYPLEPTTEDIKIEDIAHSLSLLCRANGHFPEFYSVGQHCVACCKEAVQRGYGNRLALACLLHDGAEAYLSDIPRPVKRDMPSFIAREEQLLSAIYTRFLGRDLQEGEEKLVAEVDDTMLYYEFYHYIGEKLLEPTAPLQSNPVFTFQPFSEVEQEYLDWFYKLQKQD